MAQSVTLSSAGTAVMVLNPVSKTTTALLAVTNGSSNATVQIDVSVDDPTVPGFGGVGNMQWALFSSAATMLSSQLTGGVVYTALTPIGALRINSTLLSSQASFPMRVLQSSTV